jgi:chromosome segregation ATPase
MKLAQIRVVAFAVVLFAASSGLCQTPNKEGDPLQSLRAEVHQLRIAIQGMTVASQRVQIALSQLQMQDAAVARARERLDTTHNRCLGAAGGQQRITGEMARLQSALDSGTLSESQTKQIQSNLASMKTQLDAQATEVQSCQTAEAEASGQLQSEQAKLTELQDRIERLDQSLQKLSGSQ